MLAFILPLIGLFFMVLGVVLLLRSRRSANGTITARTHRRLGRIYLVAGMILVVVGLSRLA